MKKLTPEVFDSSVVDTPIAVESKEWWEWVATIKSFRYESADGACTLVKRGSYWYAIKKVNQKPRQEYMGKDSSLTLKKLRGMNRIINLEDFVYYQARQDLIDHLNGKQSVIQYNRTCITDSEKPSVPENGDRLQNDSEQITLLTTKLTELLSKIQGNSRGYQKNSFSQGIKDLQEIGKLITSDSGN